MIQADGIEVGSWWYRRSVGHGEDVEEKGLLSVKFDLEVTPMMEIYAESCYGDDPEDSLLDGEKQGYAKVEKSHLEKLPRRNDRRLRPTHRSPNPVRVQKE